MRAASEEESCAGKEMLLFLLLSFFRSNESTSFLPAIASAIKATRIQTCQTLNDTQAHVCFGCFFSFILPNDLQNHLTTHRTVFPLNRACFHRVIIRVMNLKA